MLVSRLRIDMSLFFDIRGLVLLAGRLMAKRKKKMKKKAKQAIHQSQAPFDNHSSLYWGIGHPVERRPKDVRQMPWASSGFPPLLDTIVNKDAVQHVSMQWEIAEQVAQSMKRGRLTVQAANSEELPKSLGGQNANQGDDDPSKQIFPAHALD